MILLELKDVKIRYGKVEAVKGVSLKVLEGETVVVIGANGAGKSTILKGISGLIAISGGEIWYNGNRIDGIPGYQLVKVGISQVPEGRRLFPKMTVMENIKLGAYLRNDKAEIGTDMEKIFEILPILKKRSKQLAGTLSGGEQQMVAIARGLMSRPRLFLLDEPSLGLAPLVVKEIARIIRNIRDRGVTTILVEQNAHLALRLADKGYVLEIGTVVLEGKASELLHNEHVKKAYLGG